MPEADTIHHAATRIRPLLAETRVLRLVRPRMQESAVHGAKARDDQVYGRQGRPCPRCGEAILPRGQGDGNRITFWRPGCQP